MKKLLKLLKGQRHICFLDFEGTQFTSEMIALGGILVTLDKNGNVIKQKQPIEIYVKAKNKIGKFVENLTGIHQDKLDKVGVSFAEAMKELKKYCGASFKNCVFMTFGNHDMKIMNQSISYNLDSPTQITSVFHKNYCDYQAFISTYVKDKENNPLSLSNYLNLFGVEFKGTQHDAKDDAVNLMRLYQAFLDNKELVLDEYLKTLSNLRHMPEPIKITITKLALGEEVSSKEFVDLVRSELQ